MESISARMIRKAPTFAQNILPVVVLVAMVMGFAHEMIWEGKVPFYRDLPLYFYPIRFSLAQSFQAGELPLWDRHMAMGFPLLADFQSGVFYPPHLLFFSLPFFTAIGTIFVFHYFVAAMGSYLLCRHWRFPSYLALVGAALFTFGGLTISLTNVLNHLQTAVWLPWVILSLERTLRSQSWKPLLVFVLVLSLQFLAGSPEIYAMSLGLAFLDGLRIKQEGGSRVYTKLLLTLVGANVLVAGLTMAQLLPTLELFQESRGQARLPYSESALWSLHPVNLFNLFFLDKEVILEAGKGINFFFLRDPPFLLSYYLGAIALIGLALWLFYGSLKEKVFLSALIALSLALAMGGYTPIYPFLHRHLPLMSFFRFPEKFFFLTTALLLFVVLRGLHAHLQPRSESRDRKALAFLVLLTLLPPLGLYIFFRFDTAPLSHFIAWVGQSPLLSVATLKKTSGAMVHLERQIILISCILLVLFAWQSGKLRTGLFQALVVVFVLIDLGFAHRPYQFLLDSDMVYKSPRVLANPDSDPYRLFYYPGPSNLHPSYYALPREPSFADFQALVYSNLLPNTGVFYGFDYMQEIDALRRRPYMVFLNVANQLPSESLYRLLGALNVKHIVSFRSLERDGPNLVRHLPETPSWVYELEHVVPRVYVVSEAEVFSEPIKIVGRLAATQFDPLRKVILEEAVPTETRGDFKGRAEIVRYENRRVRIRTSLNGAGILVLADSYYPGWRAYVDGKESEILRANLFFRGVQLSAGKHVVEFRYQPRSFTIGLAISLATLIGVVVFSVIFSALERRRSVGNGPTG